MQRRQALASLGTLLVAGCASAPGDGTDATTSPTTTTEPPAPEPPERDFTVKPEGDGALVVYTDSEYLRSDGTERVTVVHGDAETVWVADEADAEQPYPLSIGNQLAVPAESGQRVAVVWTPEGGGEDVVLMETTFEG
jgi:hypothetical protein